ncbi:type II CAAX prenyl endopeptidase Rce1 family protein [Parabacteroides sp. Marseille-P3160]|uniref:CPBP family glutamic-type intramembrane protease n=1 Tax=Parabacteroides sp. Marseille-P3160 TaxID=1917887 RepID=UPI00135AF8E4
MKAFNRFIRNRGVVSSVLILWLCYTPIQISLSFFFEKILKGIDIAFYTTPNESFQNTHIVGIIFLTVIVGPLLETLIFQIAIYYLLILSKWFRRRKYMIILIGAILFGFSHFYTLSYIIYNIITGGLLMYTYTIKQHKGVYFGYWVTAILHALININAIILWKFF